MPRASNKYPPAKPRGALPASIEHIQSEKVRPLAVTAAARTDALLSVPTVSEFLPGYEASSWHGVGAPKDTPTEIVDRLNKEINAALAAPSVKARLVDLGATALSLSLADFGKHIAEETEKWGKVILCQEDAKASCCTGDEGRSFGVAL